jgi:hypothetical protein
VCQNVKYSDNIMMTYSKNVFFVTQSVKGALVIKITNAISVKLAIIFINKNVIFLLNALLELLLMMLIINVTLANFLAVKYIDNQKKLRYFFFFNIKTKEKNLNLKED